METFSNLIRFVCVGNFCSSSTNVNVEISKDNFFDQCMDASFFCGSLYGSKKLRCYVGKTEKIGLPCIYINRQLAGRVRSYLKKIIKWARKMVRKWFEEGFEKKNIT